MKKLLFNVLCCLFLSAVSYAQTITDIINEVSLDSLQLTLREFTGEQSTIVNGNEVTIINRVHTNNELAADYLFEKLEKLDNINVSNQLINGEAGRRNVIASQLGKTNPEDIYIICAHYDSMADYCADDNASGTAAVLEIARILSTQCLDNTIVYALWDEEEVGLRGAAYYASQAAANNDNILGVLNLDMMGYDGDNDNNFDIDVRNIGNSIAMKDDIISVLNNTDYGFNLVANVVNPGTSASDHSKFWNEGYSAVLVGESWETNDQTPYYHSSADRYATLNFPYYHELTKLVMGYMVTKAGLVAVDNTVIQNTNALIASQENATYQWINCDTNTEIAGETNQTFIPTINGNYAVEVSSGSCVERSACITIDSLGLAEFQEGEVSVYPNPMKNHLSIETVAGIDEISLELLDASGKVIIKETSKKQQTILHTSALNAGVYFLKIQASNKYKVSKIVKE
ncbi:M28 family peptidase [Oceanihabitans sediminis]|uniref:T9SS C-terminal target domain-containing protein n=1 Tax=Oceanihabitans sediminis TaxID=1812012 RepID=A0A368P6Z5_9FLAO|nr:M28 family peptidase [Oceanihabitans sediminis]MDX1278424.1 M28 family peptidase [Oceanihabitans sediminis]MDX1773977.1 M28 family peptidase [Oceanihabitans sediminis]RBP31996.1 putative secreted protein (Por secretion system target) [Oceanihabitans sediminis]RCU58657.1 T9SS C-terminal target domain-containing protein [Oceanihabitans sediminis]